ncbi:MAG: hypothetical protein ACLRSW_03615 [Christensenellaceae bacterium]
MIIFEGSVLEVYVNDKVAMSARMFDQENSEFLRTIRMYVSKI